MRAALRDATRTQDDYKVRVVDSAETMGDEDGGAFLLFEDGVYVGEEGLLGVCVESGGLEGVRCVLIPLIERREKDLSRR